MSAAEFHHPLAEVRAPGVMTTASDGGTTFVDINAFVSLRRHRSTSHQHGKWRISLVMMQPQVQDMFATASEDVFAVVDDFGNLVRVP